MKKKSFFYGMLSLMMAVVLCGVVSSCSSDDADDVAPWDGVISPSVFPDVNFLNYLLEQSYGRDGIITEEEMQNITELYLDEKGITSLKGIEYFTALTSLSCFGNELTSLDVSKNVRLRELYCHNNQLKSLNVSGCTVLKYLVCDNNQLTSIDVSRNTILEGLSCESNQLKSLNISNNTILEWLYCSDNQLMSLDVSANSLMKGIDCYSNQIKGKSMDALIGSLPQSPEGYIYDITLYNKDDSNEGNVCTKEQVLAAKGKGWSPKYYNDGLTYMYEGYDESKDNNDSNTSSGTDSQSVPSIVGSWKFDSSQEEGWYARNIEIVTFNTDGTGTVEGILDMEDSISSKTYKGSFVYAISWKDGIGTIRIVGVKGDLGFLYEGTYTLNDGREYGSILTSTILRLIPEITYHKQ